MKWRLNLPKIALLGIFIVLYTIDFGFNNYIVYVICAVLIIYLTITNFRKIKEMEKKSIARFNVKGSFKIEMKNIMNGWGQLFILIPFMILIYFLLPQIEIVSSLDDQILLPFISLALPSIIMEYRFFRFFVILDGLLQTSPYYLFSWSEFDNYHLEVINNKVHMSIKLKDKEWLEFDPRKLKRVDVEGIKRIFKDRNIEELKDQK